MLETHTEPAQSVIIGAFIICQRVFFGFLVGDFDAGMVIVNRSRYCGCRPAIFRSMSGPRCVVITAQNRYQTRQGNCLRLAIISRTGQRQSPVNNLLSITKIPERN
jgi:hypothetical protein